MILLKSKKEFNIGIVTIGKSPRLDIESELQKTIDYDVDFTHSGALDKIPPNQLIDLAPLSDSDTLVTLVDDNTEVQVSHEKLTEILYENISEIISKVDVIVMACTGYEEMGNYQKPILFPGKITENLIVDYSNKKDFKLSIMISIILLSILWLLSSLLTLQFPNGLIGEIIDMPWWLGGELN